jgi:hypothetical protein
MIHKENDQSYIFEVTIGINTYLFAKYYLFAVCAKMVFCQPIIYLQT